MPYSKLSDLPKTVKSKLPTHAEEIYRAAYNSAFDTYKDSEDRNGSDDRETVAHKVAWSAVKDQYEKNDNNDWVKKD